MPYLYQSRTHEVDKTTGCWNWNYSLDTDGYGRMAKKRAFKVYYERFKGEIPKGKIIDHVCFNRKCVNPDHLRAITKSENSRIKKDNKLDWNKVDEIKKLSSQGLKQYQIANRFDIHQCHVSRVLTGLRWNQS